MPKNYAIWRVQKIKSATAVKQVLKEQQRAENYKALRADPELSQKNSYSGTFDESWQNYLGLLPAKNRKNAVYGLTHLVTTSQELEPWEEEMYYTKAREWIGDHFGTVIGWAIHRDEKSTHMQVVTIPLYQNKLNAKHFLGGRADMRTRQDLFWQTCGNDLHLDRGEKLAEPAPHKTAEEHLEAQKAELKAAEAQILKEQEKLAEAKKEAVNERVQLAIQSDQLEQKKAAMARYDALEADFMTNAEQCGAADMTAYLERNNGRLTAQDVAKKAGQIIASNLKEMAMKLVSWKNRFKKHFGCDLSDIKTPADLEKASQNGLKRAQEWREELKRDRDSGMSW